MKLVQQVRRSITVTVANFELYRSAKSRSQSDFLLNGSHACFSALLQYAAEMRWQVLRDSHKKPLQVRPIAHI